MFVMKSLLAMILQTITVKQYGYVKNLKITIKKFNELDGDSIINQLII